MARITIFRPDGQRCYEKVMVTSAENGIVMFSIPKASDQSGTQVITTNLPFLIEGESE